MNPNDGLKRGVLNQTQGRLINATVIDVVRTRCSVRLATTGQVLRGIPFSGGPLVVADTCKVDYSSGYPIALVMGRTTDPVPEKKPLKIKTPIVEPPPGPGDLILRYTNNLLSGEYEVTQEGLESCAGDCEDDDIVVLPDMDLTLATPVEFNNNVRIRGQARESSILRGGLIISATIALIDFSIWVVVPSDDADAVGVLVALAGDCKINGCDVHAVNCLRGGAFAIQNAGTTTVHDSIITGESEGGIGYAVMFDSGICTLRDSQVFGSTSKYSDEDKAYVYGTTDGEAVAECEPLSDNRLMMSSSSYCYGNTQVPYQSKGEKGRTMTALTMTNSSLLSVEAGDECRGIALTPEYAFFVEDKAYGATRSFRVTRKGIAVVTSESLEENDAQPYAFTVIDNDISYVVALAGNGMRLYKVDFSTNTVSTIETWADNQGDFDLDEINAIVRTTWENKTYLTIISSWSGTNEWKAEAIVWNHSDNILVNRQIVALSSVPSQIASPFTVPAMSYDDKVIFVYPIEPIDGSYEGSYCSYPVVEVNCTTGTMTVTNDYTGAITNAYLERYIGADLSTGRLYLSIYNFNIDGDSAVIVYDIATRNLSLESAVAYYGLICGGDTSAAMLDRSVTNPIVHSLPSLAVVGSLEGTDYDNDNYVMDDTDVLWMLDSSVLRGIPMDGSAEKTIDIDWASVPFDYLNSRRVSLFIFNDCAIIGVKSLEGYPATGNQEEYFLLRKAT